MTFMTKFCVLKPISREFLTAVGHVLATKDAEREHLLGSELRFEARIKVKSFDFCKGVSAVSLHEIIHSDDDV